MLLSVLVLCLSACSSSDVDDDFNGNNQEKSGNHTGKLPTKLYIYVYSSDLPEVTRAYDGEVNSVGQEATVYSMQIWVFTHDSHKLIGYYSSSASSGFDTSQPYHLLQLTIDETYAQTEAASRENVDVYVLGNVTQESCNVTLSESSTQAQIEDALMSKTTNDPFGVTALVRSVPEGIGLPMSGVLRNQPVTGEAPVLRLDDEGEIATVMLRRIVSKLRFAFTRKTGGELPVISSIKLNSQLIPLSEYLFMTDAEPYDGHTSRIKSDAGYDPYAAELLEAPLEVTASCEQPLIYAWGHEKLEPADYEARVENAVMNNLLTQKVFYMRESNKKLEGTITYRIGEGDQQTATFRMVDEGGFSRNHVWTVYAYPAQSRLQVVVADVSLWKTVELDYDFYNW